MASAVIKAPKSARAGTVISIRVLIRHPMESGQRRDRSGARIPRNIINRLVAHYDGAEIFRAELFPAVAANPYFEFRTVATVSGDIVLSWTDDSGESASKTVSIEVT